MSTIRRNKYGKDLDLRAEASRRYRSRQAEQRSWVNQIADELGVEPTELLSHSAAVVADLLRTNDKHES